MTNFRNKLINSDYMQSRKRREKPMVKMNFLSALSHGVKTDPVQTEEKGN